MIINKSQNFTRLDAILAHHPDCKDLGQRARKRLCEQGLVFVNGYAQNALYKVREGQEITVHKEECAKKVFTKEEVQKLIVEENENYIAFYKEYNLPTSAIKHGDNVSLEDYVKAYYPELVFLNRLDNETSGIVVCAKNESAIEAWKQEQKEGNIKKEYITLVKGKFLTEMHIDLAINLNKNKVKVRPVYEEDKARHTLVKPLKVFENSSPSASLVQCTIFRGVRHQIRAHLAAMGFELLYDPLYGENVENKSFFLHHYKVESKLITAFALPRKNEEQLDDEVYDEVVNIVK